jgi:glycosyltransferase involved in cell wall biosynthesis
LSLVSRHLEGELAEGMNAQEPSRNADNLDPGAVEQQVMPHVRFSIVITCHNQRQFITDAIESVLSQNHPSKEVIVVDDGSRDGSLEVIKRYSGSVELISLPTSGGAIEARNRGAASARGEYLIFLDGDDLFAPWALDVHEQAIAEWHPATIVSRARWFSGSVPALQLTDAPKKLEFVEYESLMARDRSSGWYTGGFVMLRRAFQCVGGWSPGIFHLDLMDLAAKLRSSGNSVLVCSPYTMLYRIHDANSVHDVAQFLLAAHRLIDRERTGQYPGGRGRLERSAWYAGMVVCWSRRGMRAGLYREALWLVASGWPKMLAAMIRGSICRVRGRRPVQTRAFETKESSLCVDAS